MIKVGLTGGIGSGKTLVAGIFSKLGIPVYNADLKSKELMNTNSILKYNLINEFGDKIYCNKTLNKKLLAKIIFNNNDALAKINSIVHPFVREDFIKWCQRKIKYKYVIEESAILFETGLFKEFNKIITIISTDELKIKRVLKRNNTTEEDIRKRMKNQWSDEEKEKLSDYLIINDEKELVIPQIIKIHNELLSIS